jgi:hypothetical protein
VEGITQAPDSVAGCRSASVILARKGVSAVHLVKRSYGTGARTNEALQEQRRSS